MCIDTSLKSGALSYGELLVPGETDAEFLVSAHCCHPSLANDNLSGVVVAAALARAIMRSPQRRLSYRFVFAPGTIGAITWLARNESQVNRIQHGLVLTCVGDPGGFTYKESRQGNATIDRAAAQVLTAVAQSSVIRGQTSRNRIIQFSPSGYDERQFCSPGFNLPVGCLMRSQHGTFPEYHTSADNLGFIRPECLAESLKVVQAIVDTIKKGDNGQRQSKDVDILREDGSLQFLVQRREQPLNESGKVGGRRYVNLKPRGEPQLGRYGFYEAIGTDVMPALWVLNLSDGTCSIADIAARSGLLFDSIAKSADVLARLGLLKEARLSA